MATPSAHTRG